MSRDSFKHVVEVIKDDPLFAKHAKGGRAQWTVHYPLMTALKYFGTEGSGALQLGLCGTFRIGSGCNCNYVFQVAQALHNQRKQYTRWPSRRKRRDIANQIFDACGLPNCVGIIDGTLLSLAFCLQIQYFPDNKGHKFGYTISGLVVCNDLR